MDLIDRKLAIEKVKATADAWLPDLPYGPYKQGFILGTEVAIDTISSFVPPAEKTGKWIHHKDEHRCSCCGEAVTGDWFYEDDAYSYCPNCGARMEVEHETN